MPSSKQLSIEGALDSESIRRTEQRRVTQTDGLLSEVVENRRLDEIFAAYTQDPWVIG
jgi:hypothetical protein